MTREEAKELLPMCNITFINKYGVRTTDSMLYFDHMFNTYNFIDGSPFGIKII